MTPWRGELLILSRESAWWAILAGYIAMLAYGCVQSLDRVAGQSKQVSAATEDYRARWDKLRRDAAASEKRAWSDTRSASLVGGPTGFAIVALPADGTAALSPGESLRLSRVRRVSIYPAEPEPPLENPLITAAGPFDLSFAVLWLLPLSILAATHGAVSASRANGTWPLVLINSPRPTGVALRRVFLPASVLCGITCLAGVLAVQAAGGTSMSGWMRTAVWTLAVAVYGGIWAGLSAWINFWAGSPQQVIRISGLVWLVSVWIVPASIDVLVAARVPSANRLETHLAEREVQRDLAEKLPAMVEQVYTKHPDWRPTAEAIAAATKPIPGGPASRDARRVYAPSLAAAEATRPIEERIIRRAEAVEALSTRWAILSPVLAMQHAGDFLAGTSSRQFARLDEHARRATGAWHGFFGPRIFMLRDMTLEDLRHAPVPPPLVPQFHWGEAAWPCAILALWLAAACGGLWTAARSVIPQGDQRIDS